MDRQSRDPRLAGSGDVFAARVVAVCVCAQEIGIAGSCESGPEWALRPCSNRQASGQTRRSSKSFVQEVPHMTRVLLTTVDQDFGLYDYYRENAPERFRWRFQMPRRISFGLRFLRQNIPEINILEYPTRAEYVTALKKGWDVV